MELEYITKRIESDLKTLEQFTATPGKGCTRLPFTREARKAVDFLKAQMQEAGLKVREDMAGNVFGILEGENPDAPCVMMGSHYDSVVNGGNFDGIAGVACAIETARQLQERGSRRKRNFVAAGFCDEEGIRFGTGFFGSGSILGKRDVEYCKRYRDTEGISIYDAMKEYGLDPERIGEAGWEEGSIGYYLESHVEQGPVLETKGIELGVVDCIVGMYRCMVTVHGRADHAGTTPMDMRIDAVEAAAMVISQIPGWAREKKDETVATVGYINVLPGGINIVAEKVEFSVDIRSRNGKSIRDIVERMEQSLREAVTSCGGSYEIDVKLKIAPVHLSDWLAGLMEQFCEDRGYSYKRMASGAGHDALEIGQTIPSGLIFVGSKDGRSHCPVEFSRYEDLAKSSIITTDLAEKLLSE